MSTAPSFSWIDDDPHERPRWQAAGREKDYEVLVGFYKVLRALHRCAPEVVSESLVPCSPESRVSSSSSYTRRYWAEATESCWSSMQSYLEVVCFVSREGSSG